MRLRISAALLLAASTAYGYLAAQDRWRLALVAMFVSWCAFISTIWDAGRTTAAPRTQHGNRHDDEGGSA